MYIRFSQSMVFKATTDAKVKVNAIFYLSIDNMDYFILTFINDVIKNGGWGFLKRVVLYE